MKSAQEAVLNLGWNPNFRALRFKETCIGILRVCPGDI